MTKWRNQQVAFAMVVGGIATTILGATPGAGSPESVGLIIAAESASMIWNAVAVDDDRIFVAGPRWTGGTGPSLAVVHGDRTPTAYPNEDWNAWRPGADAWHRFVSINAIRSDSRGGLWVVDTGAPTFGADPLPGGAKVVRIRLATSEVDEIHHFSPAVALPGSYIDDIRFHGERAYLTDAGRGALIVLDLRSGKARRVLDGAVSVTAPGDRPVIMDGRTLRAPGGAVLRVNADPLEISPDGRYLFFGSLHGPWFQIETGFLDDPSLSASELAARVEPWANLPPVGGTAAGADGSVYFTELATNSLKQRRPDGSIVTIVQHALLHWVDAPAISGDWIWLPVAQIDRVALFNEGRSRVEWPVRLFRYRLSGSEKREGALESGRWAN